MKSATIITNMNDTQKLEKKMDKRFDDLTALMSDFANGVNARFDGVDARFDRLEEKLDRHEEELRKLNAKYDHCS